MKWIKKPDRNSLVPIFEQIKDEILKGLNDGGLKKGDQLPSIHKLCKTYDLAPGTVIRAYDELREDGILSSKQGKGYYIINTEVQHNSKILLLFDRMNNYKEVLYNSFLNHLNPDIEINVLFHYYDSKRFDKIIRENLRRYSHYVIMPHFNEDVSKTIAKIPERNLILIDAMVNPLKKSINAVYQDFRNDIYNSLLSNIEDIKKYDKIWFSLSQSRFQFVPENCVKGFIEFCNDFNINNEIVSNLTPDHLKKNEIYIVFSDRELLRTIKDIQDKNWTLGKDIGIISYDDTPMKELLCDGISVLTTDFTQMGITAAKMVKREISGQIANPFMLIRRNSF